METERIKNIVYSEACDDEEIWLSDTPKRFEKCWIHNGAAEVSGDVILIKEMEQVGSSLKSLILYRHKAPVVTKRTKSKLMTDYRKKHCVDEKIAKDFFYHFYGKRFYKGANLSPQSLFIPLLGDSDKDVTYVNLAAIDDLYAMEKDTSVIVFCNHLEIRLQVKLSSVRGNADKYLKHYAVYYECHNEFEVDVFSMWKGNYYQKRAEVIKAEVKKIKPKRAEAIKTKSMFTYTSTEKEVMEVSEKRLYS